MSVITLPSTLNTASTDQSIEHKIRNNINTKNKNTTTVINIEHQHQDKIKIKY